MCRLEAAAAAAAAPSPPSGPKYTVGVPSRPAYTVGGLAADSGDAGTSARLTKPLPLPDSPLPGSPPRVSPRFDSGSKDSVTGPGAGGVSAAGTLVFLEARPMRIPAGGDARSGGGGRLGAGGTAAGAEAVLVPPPGAAVSATLGATVSATLGATVSATLGDAVSAPLGDAVSATLGAAVSPPPPGAAAVSPPAAFSSRLAATLALAACRPMRMPFGTFSFFFFGGDGDVVGSGVSPAAVEGAVRALRASFSRASFPADEPEDALGGAAYSRLARARAEEPEPRAETPGVA